MTAGCFRGGEDHPNWRTPYGYRTRRRRARERSTRLATGFATPATSPTFAPDIHARVVGELSLARELLTQARNAVDDWLALETARGVIDTLDE